MSVKGSELERANDSIPTEDREWFWKENYAAVIRERDRKIGRMRRRLRILEQMVGSLKKQIRKNNEVQKEADNCGSETGDE